MRNTRRPIPECQEHCLIDALLPWYINQTLNEALCARAAAHVQKCPRCRNELAQLRLIHAEVGVPPTAAPTAPHDSLAQLLARIKAQR